MLRRLLRGEMPGPILVGDIIMHEVLAGLGSSRAASQIRERLEMQVFALFGLIATLASSHAAQAAGQPGREPGIASLAGRFLVATEALEDPNFSRTVVYLIQHDAEGAAGVVINRVVARGPLARLLEGIGVRTAGDDGTLQVRVHYGGPVEPSRVVILHTAEYQIEGTMMLRDQVAVTWSTRVLEDIAAGHGPERSLLAFGHAGWAPDRLESEITAGAWVTVPGDPELLFDDEVGTKWQRAAGAPGARSVSLRPRADTRRIPPT